MPLLINCFTSYHNPSQNPILSLIPLYISLILSTASTVFSLYDPNAVSLKYPSPARPEPLPGVPDHIRPFQQIIKSSQLPICPRRLHPHIRRIHPKPYTSYPALFLAPPDITRIFHIPVHHAADLRLPFLIDRQPPRALCTI